MRWTFVIPVSTCPSRSVARNDNSFVPRVLKGHGFSRAVTCARRVGLQPLGKLALRLNTEVPQWLEHFHTWCIGWSGASPGLFTSLRRGSKWRARLGKARRTCRRKLPRRVKISVAGGTRSSRGRKASVGSTLRPGRCQRAYFSEATRIASAAGHRLEGVLPERLKRPAAGAMHHHPAYRAGDQRSQFEQAYPQGLDLRLAQRRGQIQTLRVRLFKL